MKLNKNIKGFLYSLPFIITSFLPIQKANSQEMKTNAYERYDAKELTYTTKSNNIYLGFQPIDLGVSLGYGKKINEKIGTYAFISKGKYRSPLSVDKEEFKNSYIDHYKISLGTKIYFERDKDFTIGFISLGASYNEFNKKNYTSNKINEKALKRFSLEGGAGITLEEKLTFGFLFDPIKGESNVYLGIPFN